MAVRLVKRLGSDVHYADATSLGLRVERDGERFQYCALVASGQEIRVGHGIDPGGEFASAAVTVAVEQVRESLPKADSLDDPRQPICLSLDVGRVAQRLASGVELPMFAEDQVIDEWTE